LFARAIEESGDTTPTTRRGIIVKILKDESRPVVTKTLAKNFEFAFLKTPQRMDGNSQRGATGMETPCIEEAN